MFSKVIDVSSSYFIQAPFYTGIRIFLASLIICFEMILTGMLLELG
jgi:hypothetical protein